MYYCEQMYITEIVTRVEPSHICIYIFASRRKMQARKNVKHGTTEAYNEKQKKGKNPKQVVRTESVAQFFVFVLFVFVLLF